MTDAAVLVRTARKRAQLSARDLAARAGVSPSTVTRIERGEINPTLVMLERLLDASGNQLVVTVEPRPQRPTLDALRQHRDDIIAVVASFGGRNVRVFGSVARGEAHDGSDVDVLIDVPAGTGLVTVERIAEALSAVLPWPVDVVTGGAARRRMAHVLDEAVPL
jgi:predicted nucleotidyltransferase/DNA-binding XRE family transcriptional regulator